MGARSWWFVQLPLERQARARGASLVGLFSSVPLFLFVAGAVIAIPLWKGPMDVGGIICLGPIAGLLLALVIHFAACRTGWRLSGLGWLVVPCLFLGMTIMINRSSPVRNGHSETERLATREQYRQAIAKLNESDGAERDAALCKALVSVLDDLAARSDPTIYVVVTDVSDPVDPPEAARDVAKWKEDLEFRGQAPDILPQDVIFGGDAAGRRQKEFLEQLQGALKTMVDESLLKLVPLEAGATPDGKIVLDIRATSHRGEAYKKVRLVNAPYLLREFSIDWEVKLTNREGRALATVMASAKPGTLYVQVESGTWQYEDPKGQLRHLGEVASWSQLASAYAEFRRLLEKKLGTSPEH